MPKHTLTQLNWSAGSGILTAHNLNLLIRNYLYLILNRDCISRHKNQKSHFRNQCCGAGASGAEIILWYTGAGTSY